MFGTYSRWLNTMTGPFTSQNKLTLTFNSPKMSQQVLFIYALFSTLLVSLISMKSYCSLAMCLMKTAESTTKYIVYIIYWLKFSPQVLLRKSWLISLILSSIVQFPPTYLDNWLFFLSVNLLHVKHAPVDHFLSSLQPFLFENKEHVRCRHTTEHYSNLHFVQLVKSMQIQYIRFLC